MGTLNPDLSTIIKKHITPIKQKTKVLNNESDVICLIKELGMLNIDGCTVTFKLNINSIFQIAHEEGLSFHNIRIVNSILDKGVTFYDVHIPGNLYFWENVCGACDFSSLEVDGFSYFSNSLFHHGVLFDHAVFHKDTFCWGVEFKGDVSFRNCIFNGRIDFWCATFENKVDLSHSGFYKDVDFSNTLFQDKLLLNDTSFGKTDETSLAIFDNMKCFSLVSFGDSSFRSEISLCKSYFYDLLDFSRCSIYHTLTSSETTFKRLSFNYTHVYSPLYLLDVQGNTKSLDFQHIWADSIINILNKTSNCLSHISFNNSIFSNNSIITIEGINLENNSLSLNFCNILGVISIYSSKIALLEMKCTSVIGSFIIKDTRINLTDLTNSTSTGRIITDSKYCLQSRNRETANILRHQKENEGDIILSLKYKEKEMRHYNEDFSKLSFVDKLRNFDEIIIVKLNYWSSDYGQSWTRGICFTLIISTIFTFLLALINHEIQWCNLLSFVSNKDFWKEVINFLWFPSTDFKSDALIYIITSLLGKVLVAYGMFQIAMSFRKYSKS